ncbi:MAG: RecX family transcriptional regulator [Bryobacteraceae bacterium]
MSVRVRKLEAPALWDYALGALGRRALTVGELRRRLELRAVSKADVDPVLAKLKEYGYLNDQRFAETFAQARLDNEGLGKGRVLRDLRTRRVSSDVAEKAVAKAYSEADETALVEQFLARKLRNRNLPEFLREPKNLASTYRKLLYAGFRGGVAIRVLRRYTDRADELETE